MNDRPAIEVRQLAKRYRLGATASLDQTLGEMLRGRVGRLLGRRSDANHPDRDFWALRDVSFEVARGEVIGVVGRNGAGKSTLLKILSQITAPTEGEAIIRGRVGSLLEVGTGFHPELTGRENIYLNGTILGMRKAEIDARFDQIVAFSGISPFLDTPVKRYSSGMYVRLAFAVAAHLEPEILVVDEVLAVGDFDFQRKCLGKMADVAGAGRTVLFVSHNMAAVQNLCQRVIWLNEGRVEQIGPTGPTVAAYLGRGETTDLANRDLQRFRTVDSQPVIQRIALLDDRGRPTDQAQVGAGLTVRIDYETDQPIREPSFGIGLDSLDGQRLVSFKLREQQRIEGALPACGAALCHIPALPLAPGVYCLSFDCVSGNQQLDALHRPIQLRIEPADFFGTGQLPPAKHGAFLLRAEWEIRSERSSRLAGAA